MSKTFLIVGDSWSQGEIEHYPGQERSHVVVHQGLIQYLKDAGHTVYNRGGLGWSNVEAYWQTYSAFFDNTHNKYPPPIGDDIDYIIWFTTDSFRDLEESQYWERIKFNKSIRKTFVETLDGCYSKFNDLSDRIGKKISLIGGWTPVSPEVDKYKNLETIIPNVHNLLVPESDISITQACLHLYPYIRQTAKTAKDVLTNEEIDFIKQEIVELSIELNYAEKVRFTNRSLFYPDYHHPNRQGHYKIFEKVKETLNLN